MPTIRELAFELLDDEQGITSDAWSILYALLKEEDSHSADLIAKALDGSEGRVYLPTGFREEWE